MAKVVRVEVAREGKAKMNQVPVLKKMALMRNDLRNVVDLQPVHEKELKDFQMLR